MGGVRRTFGAGAALGLLALSGCASVMSGSHAEVGFYSNVPNGVVVIRDKRGREVTTAQIGSTVALRRKERHIFPAKYIATFAAPGYQSANVELRSKLNPWIWANAAFGYAGIVGLAVDNMTGAAWTPREASIYQELMPVQFSQGGQPQGPPGPQVAVGAPPGTIQSPAFVSMVEGAGTPAAAPIMQTAVQDGPAMMGSPEAPVYRPAVY